MSDQAEQDRSSGGHRRPSVAVDTAVLTVDVRNGALGVVQHQRRGEWALPGTFLHEGETLADAVLRSLAEEVGFRGTRPQQLHVFEDTERDDRGWVLCVAHVVLLLAEDVDPVVASRDDVRVLPVDDAVGQPFDHEVIVRLAVDRVRQDYALQPDPAGLLGEAFPLKALQALHDAVAPQPGPGESRPSIDTFRRYMVGKGLIQPTGEFARKERPGAMGKPAELYRRAGDSRDATDVLGIRPVRQERNRAERPVDDAGPARTFGELGAQNVAPAIQRLVDEVGALVPLTLTVMPHYVAVRLVGEERVAAYARPQTLSVGLDPDAAVTVAEDDPDFRLERTSAATHHLHVPAAALDEPARRQVARAVLEQALARIAGAR
ncbi:NUDIX domain-containing protein [Modestobacter sp. VKM Ac-2979]|uniref:NUDIX hydrolase n=1 Tax=unclassified Modestobacter TaxID=2643866 RepID=UPI0022AB71E7|nr:MULTISPECIES: NUDIX domain-containing protein [unclassified Modestobacter]MCZ2813847.1 NUDIX domain-containing protein [Modestobacter sp. VKM Ac-2979]MCZ2844178.1 NUDIX domain-containing protein [Modestobacter sp. VKM Ac-2980]